MQVHLKPCAGSEAICWSIVHQKLCSSLSEAFCRFISLEVFFFFLFVFFFFFVFLCFFFCCFFFFFFFFVVVVFQKFRAGSSETLRRFLTSFLPVHQKLRRFIRSIVPLHRKLAPIYQKRLRRFIRNFL